MIVTKNRVKDLRECLQSLQQQTQALDELVVIDNHSKDDTRKTIKEFAETVTFPVRCILEKKIGFPIIYNRGLKESKYNWIAFIDDDCVAGKNWFLNIKKAVVVNRNIAAILGYSDAYYADNIYSLATFFFNYQWKENGSNKNGEILDLEILDNRNIVYNKNFLNKKKLTFDESRIGKYKGGAEDCDLGMQVQLKKGRAIYKKDISVKHKDPTTFSSYFKKLVISVRAYETYKIKWSAFRENLPVFSRLKARDLFPQFTKKYDLSLWQKVSLFGILLLTIIVKKIILAVWK